LRGTCAFITGAASGQGRATARLFAEEGANVLVFDRDAAGASETADAIREAGGSVHVCVGDVAKSADVAAAVRAARAAFGAVHVLYNNAAVWAPGRMDNVVADIDESGWDTILDGNLKGVDLCCKYAIPAIIEAGGGSVINIASVAWLVGSRNASHAYSASKGGVISLTRAMSIAYARAGVRVNAICPGGVDTPMLAPLIATPGRYERVAKSHPLGGLGTPEDMARCAFFLASEESSRITGTVIPVDGAISAS